MLCWSFEAIEDTEKWGDGGKIQAEGDDMYFAKLLGLFAALFLIAGMSVATDQPLYDEKADAHQQVATARAAARHSGRNVVLVFGANW